MVSTTGLRKTCTEAAKHLSGAKPFYAVAGAGDLAVEKLKAVPSMLRHEVTVSKIKSAPDRVRTELTSIDGAVQKVADKMAEMPRDPRKLTTKLTVLADEQAKAADQGLLSLTQRGEKVLDRLREENKDLLDKAKKAVQKVRHLRGPEEVPVAAAPPPARKPAPKATPAAPAPTAE